MQNQEDIIRVRKMRRENNFKKLISKKEINNKIKELADEINRTYKGKEVLVIGILKGAFIFMADLIRNLDLKMELDFMELSSYGSQTETSGEVKLVKGLSTEIKNKEVLVVEDIIDTGLTLSYILNFLKKRDPKSLRICALANKPSRRKIDVSIHFLGFTIPDKFIVGYGIDYNQLYRNLPEIYYLDE
jgi:hypoxanthine phosphoribosyltransferase